MKDRIKVKRKHIEDGDPSSLCGCAIGLALQDAGIPQEHLDIDRDTITIAGTVFRCPVELRKFQTLGLNGKKQAPIEFKISDLKPIALNADYTFA